MADRSKPFVDRRLSVSVLFKGSEQNISDITVQSAVETAIEDMGLNTYVTQTSSKKSPPQGQAILNTSRMKASNIGEMGEIVEDELESAGFPVQDVAIVSVALSPGDKVRNAIGV